METGKLSFVAEIELFFDSLAKLIRAFFAFLGIEDFSFGF